MKLREKTNIQICEENNLKHTFLLNVVEETTTKNKIRATMELIAKILCGTLGPYGSTTITQDRQGNHLPTKDGHDLMVRVNISDEVARTIIDILRNITSDQASSVGDGTTSAIIVAASLYRAITDTENKKLFDRVAPKDVVDMLNYLESILYDYIKMEAKPISEDMKEIDMVASISTNNDKETGKLVGDIYKKIGRYGFITNDVVDPVEKDKVEFVEGISWKRGYIEDCFSVGTKSKKITHELPYLFMTDMYFTQDDLPLLADVIGECARNDREVVIICNGADEDARTFFKKNRTKHLASNTPELKFSVVDIDNVTETGKSTLRDLAVLTGGIIYSPLTNPQHTHPYFTLHKEDFYGKAERAVLSPKESQFICDPEFLTEEEKNAKDRLLAEILAELNEMEMNKEKSIEEAQRYYNLKLEYNTLLGNAAIFHVGGKTLTERMSRERLIDDATKACRSALQNGIVYGGNLVIPKIITTNKEYLRDKLNERFGYLVDNDLTFFEDFLNIIKETFLESYKHVLENANITEEKIAEIVNKCIEESKFYNLKIRKFEDMQSTSVINSVDTDIQIMKTCFSIIGILATSNQFITLNPDIDGATR